MTRDVSAGVLLGLNNRLPLTRMGTTLAGGVSAAWLRVAHNIDLTANGFVRRRAGFAAAAAAAGAWHSLWADALGAYGVCNGDLVCIAPRTLARTVVVPGVGQGRVSFARLPDGLVYWTNGERIGRRDGAAPRASPALGPRSPLAGAARGRTIKRRSSTCGQVHVVEVEMNQHQPRPSCPHLSLHY